MKRLLKIGLSFGVLHGTLLVLIFSYNRYISHSNAVFPIILALLGSFILIYIGLLKYKNPLLGDPTFLTSLFLTFIVAEMGTLFITGYVKLLSLLDNASDVTSDVFMIFSGLAIGLSLLISQLEIKIKRRVINNDILDHDV